jgi:hypothetical protein
MKKYFNLQLLIVCLLLTFSLSSCEAIAGIFKAGVWTGIIVVVLIIALVVFLMSRAGKK